MTLQEEHWSRWAARLRKFPFVRIDIALALLVTLTGLTLFVFSGINGDNRAGFVFLQNIEQSSLDTRFSLRGARLHDPRIVIVGIDERTLQKINSFPLPRSNYAALVARLNAAGARVIALDETFPTPESNSGPQALQQLQKNLGPSISPNVLKQVKELELSTDQDANFAAALKKGGDVILGHLFLNPERAKSAETKSPDEYFNIVWAQTFPQVVPVKPKNGKAFDMGTAWIQNGGTVAAGVEANITKIAESAASYGFLNINPDADGTLRRALLMIRYQDKDFFPSLPLQVLREYEKIPDQQIVAYIAEDGLERIQFGEHLLRPSRNGTALINYTGPYNTYPHHSMADVIEGTTPPDAFRGKIVLVGATALATGDVRNTPWQDTGYMGVEVHANIIDNLLHSGEKGRGFLNRGTDEEIVDVAFILIFGLLFGFIFSRIAPLYSTITVIVTLVAFACFVYFSFASHGRWLSFVSPAGTLAANYAAITSFRMIREERAKRQIRKSFSQYLSPGVIELIEKDPEKYIRPGGEMKELTIMFSDIRSFTTLSEGLSPDDLVHLLNEYFGAMTEIIFSYQGTLDKYIGDAIMAFWGSPYPQLDHAFRSCSCALEMVRGLEKLNLKWRNEGRPPIAVGIGLNTGLVNVGNMGSDRRLAWTVMGDNVNLASRLEGITKQYHSKLVISEATYREIASQFVCRELDKIKVKGKNQPVNIYELLDVAAERPQYEALLQQFDHAMAAYRNQDWQEAADRFAQILTIYPDDGPTQAFLERAEEFIEEAPQADWDGVYVMKTK
jgi:adenylate cyclase